MAKVHTCSNFLCSGPRLSKLALAAVVVGWDPPAFFFLEAGELGSDAGSLFGGTLPARIFLKATESSYR